MNGLQKNPECLVNAAQFDIDPDLSLGAFSAPAGPKRPGKRKGAFMVSLLC
jgi:hypothetical protein